jgi:hypothetical protein
MSRVCDVLRICLCGEEDLYDCMFMSLATVRPRGGAATDKFLDLRALEKMWEPFAVAKVCNTYDSGN